MTTTFAAALSSGDLEAVRAWPKSDLHNHGALSGDRAFLLARTGRDIAPLAQPLRSMDEMHAWVGASLGPIFTGSSGRLLGFEAAFALARRDGVKRIELGDDVWQVTQGCGTAQDLLRSLECLHQSVAPDVEWIPLIGMSRHCPVSSLERWIAPFLQLSAYRSLDLSGDELCQPIERAFVSFIVWPRQKAFA